jgi:hypothetical protein
MSEISQFQEIEVMPPDELLERLRDTPLLNQPEIRPYANATLSIERFKLSELLPTSKYAQEDLIAVQGVLRATLLPQGYDQLDLKQGRLTLSNDEGSTVRIAPPIVERYEPDGMDKYVLDGSHRSELARRVALEEGEEDPELTVIYVRDGITHPPYALTNSWDEVHVVSERPVDKAEWKNYRDYANRYDLYRDYNDVFDSTPRGLDKK